MEDAMIINKGSFDRGFGHGVVYTHTVIVYVFDSFPHAVFVLVPQAPLAPSEPLVVEQDVVPWRSRI